MQAGTELAGRYVLEKVLGSGGMCDVWRGTDRQLGRSVAVKVMQDRYADPRRFEREAKITARLQHRGITIVHDVGEHDGQPFMVMELLRGSDLAAVLNRAPGRQLPVEMAVALIVEVAGALQAAHSADVIHRDLKPANLFCQDNGSVKICDFGIARMTDAAESLTTGGYVIGTPPYMSPEQCAGESIDKRSDLYSLGCVLYELLTGQPPFPGGQRREVMNQHMTTPPASLRTLRPDIPGKLDAIVLRMLAKDPGDRPDNAGVLIVALQAVLRLGASAASNSTLHTAAASAGPAAADGGSTVTSDGAQERQTQTRMNPQAAAGEPDRILATSPPLSAGLQLQVAPLAGSWSLLALDPLGRWLASADGDGTITLWDIASGLPVRSWSAEAHVLTMTAGRGNRLAVGGDDGRARIWEIERASPGDEFGGHAGDVLAVAFDQRGVRLATGDADGVVRLWEAGGRPPVSARHPAAYGAITILAFDASGARLAAGGEDDALRIWDVGSPHKATLLAEQPYAEEVTALAFGAGGQLAIGAADGQVRAWKLGPPQRLEQPAGQAHDGSVLALGWGDGQGRWISVGADGRLHDEYGQGQPVVAHGRVRAAAVSLATGRGAVIDDSSGYIHTFRVGDRSFRQVLQGSDISLNGVAFGPAEGSLVTGGTDGVLHVWNPERHSLRSAATAGSSISAIAGSPDGRRAVVCRGDGSVTGYGIAAGTATLTEVWARQCHEPASAVAISPDESSVATAGDAVRVWRIRDGVADDPLPENMHRTRALSYDRTGRQLAAAGTDGAVLVWDVAKAILRRTLVRHKGVVHAAAFSPLSGQLATAGSDGTVRIWDPENGDHLHCLSGWECRASALTFSPADGALAIGGIDGVVRFREPCNWTQTRAWPGHVHGITAMCFDAHGERLVTAGQDGTVRVWTVATDAAELVLLPLRDRWAAAEADGTVRGHGDAAGLIWFANGLSRQPSTHAKLSGDDR